MDGELPQVRVQRSAAQQLPRLLDQVPSLSYRHLKLRKDVLNINNIPSPTDVKSNFRIYGRVRILEDERAGYFQDEYGDGREGVTATKFVTATENA